MDLNINSVVRLILKLYFVQNQINNIIARISLLASCDHLHVVRA